MTETHLPRYLREKQVAALLNISVYTLQKHRQKRIGLPFIKLRGVVLYANDAVIASLKAATVATSA